MKYIIRSSIVEWFSGYGFIEVGGNQANAQFWFAILVKLFANYCKTVDLLSGMVNLLDDACYLHFYQMLLIDVLAQAYMESF